MKLSEKIKYTFLVIAMVVVFVFVLTVALAEPILLIAALAKYVFGL